MSYLPATLVSLILHGVLIFLVMKGWHHTKPESPKPPSYIKATLLDMKAQGKQSAPKPKPEVKPEPPQPEPDLQKIEIEKQRKQEQLAKQKQIALDKAKKEKEEKEKQEKLKREKQKQEEEKKLAQQREKEKRKKEQEKKEKERKERERKQKEQLQAELEAEKQVQQAEDDQQLSQSYANVIRQRVEQSWSRPPSARNGMKTELTIQLVPTGEVIDVVVTKSSGNSAFDRSAIQAVKRVGQFEELKSMPSRLFEREFRKFKLLFQPQDLRQ